MNRDRQTQINCKQTNSSKWFFFYLIIEYFFTVVSICSQQIDLAVIIPVASGASLGSDFCCVLANIIVSVLLLRHFSSPTSPLLVLLLLHVISMTSAAVLSQRDRAGLARKIWVTVLFPDYKGSRSDRREKVIETGRASSWAATILHNFWGREETALPKCQTSSLLIRLTE